MIVKIATLVDVGCVDVWRAEGMIYVGGSPATLREQYVIPWTSN